MTLKDDAISLHRILKGKIEIKSKVADTSTDGKNDMLSLIYSPGVAYVAQEISGDKSLAYEYTSKKWIMFPSFAMVSSISQSRKCRAKAPLG